MQSTPIDPDRLEQLFHLALEIAPGGRAAFLADACSGDQSLYSSVQALLEAADAVDKNPAWAASALTNEAASALTNEAASALTNEAASALTNEAASALTNEAFAGCCGAELDRYRLTSLIGAGGMGVVYKAARSGDYTKIVAVKIVLAADPASVEQFRREREILARLEHPHIARLLDGGSTPDGLPFVVMEYVDGVPVDRYVREHKLPERAVLELFRDICSAVFYAHANLVVHRDLKPANILVTVPEGGGPGQPKLLDFGIAKCLDGSGLRTRPGAGAMTPEYASPEQVQGAPITTASDIYSLGVILYELLTGARPYRRAGALDLSREICVSTPEPMGARAGRRFDPDLEKIVQMALRKEPSRRYASVGEFSEDIRRYLEGYPIVARPATRRYRISKFIGRNKAAMAAAAVVLLTLVCGIVTTSWQARVADRRFREVRALAHSVLFDYHDAIAGLPGSTPARAMLANDALRYLDVMGKEAGGDTALQLELASAYIRLGDVQGRPYAPNLGQTDGALATYRKGLAILESISVTDPLNRQAQRQLAMGLERIGNIQLRKGQNAASTATHRRALQIRERWAAANPADAESRRDLAASYLYLGDVLQVGCFSPPDVACLQNVLELQRKALTMRQELARQNPADLQRRRELAQAYMRVGFRLRDLSYMTSDTGLLRQALESHQMGVQTEEAVAAANPSSARDRRDATDQRFVMGQVQASLGDYAGALQGYRSALATFQSLSAADPANTESRRDVSFVYQKMAQVLAQKGDFAEAEQMSDIALDLALKLLAADPASNEDRNQVAGLYAGKSQLAERNGDFARAAEYYAKSVADTPTSQSFYHIAALYMAAAKRPHTAAQQAEYWRAARDAERRCLEILDARAAKASLPPAEAEVRRLAAHDLTLCEAALAAVR